MVDSKNKNFINISNRKFEQCVYYNKDYSGLGYKPKKAFWCTVESEDSTYESKWDELYGDVLYSENDAYITTVRYKNNTFLFNPGLYEESLEQFYSLISSEDYQNIDDTEIRKLFIGFLKKRNVIDDSVKYIVCQLDLEEDIKALERIFGNYEFGKENDNKVYTELNYNVRKGLIKCFHGFEVTDFFLDDIWDVELYKNSIDSNYNSSFDNFEIYSVAFFDTGAFDVMSEKIKQPSKKI